LKDLVEVRAHLQRIGAACDRLRKSEALKVVMRTVLTLGNLTNYRYGRRPTTWMAGQPMTAQPNGATGFKIDALIKLKDVRGKDGKTTLMHYLVEVLWGVSGTMELPTVFQDLQMLKDVKVKDLYENIRDIERLVSEILSWKTTEFQKVDLDILEWAEDSSSDHSLTQALPQQVNGYANSVKSWIKPLLNSIRRSVIETKIQWHLMWWTYFDASLYFGEDPQTLDAPCNHDRLAVERMLSKLQSGEAVDSATMTLSQSALPGASAGAANNSNATNGRRPDEMFEVFHAFFSGFREAIDRVKRSKERVVKKKGQG
jgi:hypothetical protein